MKPLHKSTRNKTRPPKISGSGGQVYRGGKSLNIPKLIDKFLAGYVVIKEGKTSRRVTRFEAICLQLYIKSVTGHRRATRVLMRYVKYAAAHGGVGDVRLYFPEKDEK